MSPSCVRHYRFCVKRCVRVSLIARRIYHSGYLHGNTSARKSLAWRPCPQSFILLRPVTQWESSSSESSSGTAMGLCRILKRRPTIANETQGTPHGLNYDHLQEVRRSRLTANKPPKRWPGGACLADFRASFAGFSPG